MTQKVLLTGGTGYLGNRMAKRLVASGSVTYLYLRNIEDQEKFTELKGNLHFVGKDDLTNLPSLDFIIHMATAYGRKGETKEQIFKANVEFPKNLISSVDHSKLTFINTDTSLPAHLGDYAASKEEFRNFLASGSNDFNVINIKLEQFFGPNDGSFLGFVYRNLLSGNEVELTDGLQKRDFIYVEDVLDTYEFLMKKSSDLGKGFHEFSLGSGEAHSIRHVVSTLCEIMKADESKLLWGRRAKREGEPESLEANLEGLKSLGHKLNYTLEEGLRELVSLSEGRGN